MDYQKSVADKKNEHHASFVWSAAGLCSAFLSTCRRDSRKRCREKVFGLLAIFRKRMPLHGSCRKLQRRSPPLTPPAISPCRLTIRQPSGPATVAPHHEGNHACYLWVARYKFSATLASKSEATVVVCTAGPYLEQCDGLQYDVFLTLLQVGSTPDKWLELYQWSSTSFPTGCCRVRPSNISLSTNAVAHDHPTQRQCH